MSVKEESSLVLMVATEEDTQASTFSKTAVIFDEFSSSLCEDMEFEILSRLPPKVLFRFKCVSRSWFSLIHQNLTTSKRFPSSMLGFFYHRGPRLNPSAPNFEQLHNEDNESIDTTLSFLPCHPNVEIIDSCNGLLLCRQGQYNKGIDHYVCNPATKRWAALPRLPISVDSPLQSARLMVRLAYDPFVSPHHKVIFVSFFDHPSKIHIFSSETANEGWVKHTISFHDKVLCLSGENNHLFGDPLLHCPNGLFSDGTLYLSYECHILRCTRLQDEVPHVTVIMLPHDYLDFRIATVGILGGSVCCASMHGPHLQVWKLKLDGDTDASWVLKHNCNITEHNKAIESGEEQTVVLAFHPFLEMVLIQTADGVLGYNLKSMTRENVGVLGTETKILAFPYTPCSKDDLKVNS